MLRSLARALVAAGADVVFGSHPHVLQGIEELDGAVVAYSLGNLAWYHDGVDAGATALVRVSLSEGRAEGFSVVPAVLDAVGRPTPVTGERADQILGMTAGCAN
jgi:poly-gamma-glutamate synthesis protein (capsule biosynthesis protein)